MEKALERNLVCIICVKNRTQVKVCNECWKATVPTEKLRIETIVLLALRMLFCEYLEKGIAELYSNTPLLVYTYQ